MADVEFDRNLMKMIAAELHFLNGMTAAREMFGKSYFSLGISEKALVDQATIDHVGANYRGLTPEFLAEPRAQETMGFRPPSEPMPP